MQSAPSSTYSKPIFNPNSNYHPQKLFQGPFTSNLTIRNLTKSLSFPTQPFQKSKASPIFLLENVKKIGDITKQQIDCFGSIQKEPGFWLINDELKDSQFLQKFIVLEVKQSGDHTKLIKCKNMLNSAENLIKYVNLKSELKSRELFT